MRAHGENMARMRALAVCLVVCPAYLAQMPLPAEAQDPSESPAARLEYSVADGMENCPSMEGVRARIAAHLGYDPIRDDAERNVSLSLRMRDGLALAAIEISNPGDQPRLRELAGEGCEALVASAVLTLAIAIDPTGAGAPDSQTHNDDARRGTSVNESGRTQSPVATDNEVPPFKKGTGSDGTVRGAAPSDDPLILSGMAGALGSVGAAPQATPGFTAAFAFRWDALEVGIGGRNDFSATVRGEGGEATGSVLAAELTGCGFLSPLFGCGIAQAGAFFGSGDDFATNESITKVYVAVGVRAGVELPLVRPLHFRIYIDGLAPLARTDLLVAETRVWRMPAFSGAMGFQLVLRFHDGSPVPAAN